MVDLVEMAYAYHAIDSCIMLAHTAVGFHARRWCKQGCRFFPLLGADTYSLSYTCLLQAVGPATSQSSTVDMRHTISSSYHRWQFSLASAICSGLPAPVGYGAHCKSMTDRWVHQHIAAAAVRARQQHARHWSSHFNFLNKQYFG